MKVQKMNKLLLALAVSAALGLAGCGGSGAGAGGTDPASIAAKDSQKTRIMLSANAQELLTDGRTPVDLTAVVTDAISGVALADQKVEFATRDSGVRLEITRDVTDATGVALARLYLNGDPTPRSVTVLATVGQQSPAELIIAVRGTATNQSAVGNNRGELSVRIGTDNLIEDMKETLSYRKNYAIIVTDNAGVGQPNASIAATLRSFSYRVGYWKGGSGGWSPLYLDSYNSETGMPTNFTYPAGYNHPAGAPTGIPTEDRNNPGVCDAGEDWNGDGVLTPGNIATAAVQSLTDASGVAVMSITYPKSFAMWANLQLEVTAVVGGTESKNAIFIPLPILAADVTNPDVPPPSMSRTRGSLSTPRMQFPIQVSEEYLPQSVVNGSPFPYWSGDGSRATCP